MSSFEIWDFVSILEHLLDVDKIKLLCFLPIAYIVNPSKNKILLIFLKKQNSILFLNCWAFGCKLAYEFLIQGPLDSKGAFHISSTWEEQDNLKRINHQVSWSKT